MTVWILAMGWPVVILPLGLDQGIYAVNATRMWEGFALYSGAWDMKAPAIFFMYFPLVKIAPMSTWPIHLMHLPIVFFTALALFRFTAQTFGRGMAWMIFIFYPLVHFSWGTPISLGQPDDWLLPFYLWSLLWISDVRTPARRGFIANWRIYASGAMMAWVVLLRPTMLPAIILPIVFFCGRKQTTDQTDGKDNSARFLWRYLLPDLRLLGIYVAGGSTIGIIMLLYFLATDSIGDFLYTQLNWNKQYAQTLSPFRDISIEFLYNTFIKEWSKHFKKCREMTWALPSGMIGLFIWHMLDRPIPLRALSIWLVGLLGGCGSLFIQLKFFNYHFWPLLPFLSISFIFGIYMLGAIWTTAWLRIRQTPKPAKRHLGNAIQIEEHVAHRLRQAEIT